jgi:hypothetical protein
MFRLSVGPGYGAFIQRSNPELSIRGLGLTVSVDIGYALDRDWVLHLRYANTNVLSGSAYRGGEEIALTESPFAAAQIVAVAGTYYLMPHNLFATLALGLGTTTMQIDTYRDTDTDVGYGMCLDAGKEWWVGRHLGIGAALRLWLSAMATESGANVYAPYVGLMATATYQ